MTAVVLLQPGGIVDRGVIDAAPTGVEMHVVCWESAPTAGVPAVPVARAGLTDVIALRAERALRSSTVGRTAFRLSPFDGSVRFARAVARSADAMRLLAAADLVVAGERDAILAAWRAGRRLGRVGGPAVVFGTAAGWRWAEAHA